MEEDFEPVIREDAKDVKPWHLLTEDKATKEESGRRYAICEKCPFLRTVSRTCVKCGCFMKAKTTIQSAECPIHKW